MTRPQPTPAGADPCVGSRRAAVLLGVDERTVVRWADDGHLPVSHRTRGGHRRFRLADVQALLEQPHPTESEPVQ